MTHNQINFWSMRNEDLNKQRQIAETHRYNLVQEELKRIDQDLQRDLMNINRKYQEAQIALGQEELAWKKSYQNRQLNLDAMRVAATQYANSLNSMAIQETKRSNKVQESLRDRSVAIDEAMLPLNQASSRAHTSYVRAQTTTERDRPAQVRASTFNNFVSPIVNLAGTVLRAVK